MSVKIVFRRFEIACLVIAFLALVLSLVGGRLSTVDKSLLLSLANIFTGAG